MVPTASSALSLDSLDVRVATLQGQFLSSPYWSIRQLVCEIDCDRVVLRGTLPSFYQKQVAQSLALKVAGDNRVQCDIEVRSE